MTVSQGSAAVSFRNGGICNDNFVANFVPSLAVKEFSKSINISRSYQHEYGVLFFYLYSGGRTQNPISDTLSGDSGVTKVGVTRCGN